LVIFDETTGIPPAIATISVLLRRPPIPRPIELLFLVASCAVVPDKGDLGVFVYVWINVEFFCDERI
jgi:hypothetical protein